MYFWLVHCGPLFIWLGSTHKVIFFYQILKLFQKKLPSSEMWHQTNLKTGMMKAVVEQFTYGPAASVTFFYGMSLLEFKTHKEAVTEVKQKFPETWKVAVCVWPVVQTINFSFIPEKNRVPFVSMASLLWTTFLAYMKQLEHKNEQEKDLSR